MDVLSVTFLIFVLVGVAVYYSVPKAWQWKVLMLWSVVFYLSVSIKAGIWLCLTIVLSFYAGKWMEQYAGCKKKILAAVVSLDVSMLFALKYLGYGFGLLGIECDLAGLGFVLPMGISFYSLQAVGYLADVYARKIKAEENIIKFALFIMYFPHILQGPIGRYGDLKAQLFTDRDWDEGNFKTGIELMVYGFFKKMVIADRAALFVDSVYVSVDFVGGSEVYLASVLYSIQLYMDFSGCVDIMRGISYLFGIRLAENFDHPYFAVSIKDFWRRWHISLSSWLCDYIYIPLGGNRKGKARKYISLYYIGKYCCLFYHKENKHVFF